MDTSLYNTSGEAGWAHLCTETASSECVPGTDSGFNGPAMARMLGALLESDRAVYMFLDEEFHPKLFAAAAQLADDGELDIWLIDSEILIWRFAGATDLTSADR